MQLLAMCVAVVLDQQHRRTTIQLFLDICVATLELNYLRYSCGTCWIHHGNCIPENWLALLKQLVFLAPLIFFFMRRRYPAALDAMRAMRLELAYIVETGSVVKQAFFVSRTDRFMIMARHGRVSSIFMYIGSLMLEQGTFSYWLLMVGLYVGTTLTVLVLYVMKLALYKCGAKSLEVVGGSTITTHRKEEVVSVKELVHVVRD
ncbi:hypothetical protein BJ741DRAFT_629336 [Chytriomyces cf. hyalinus JEL632]|nr:hypothetical protein BJ741DRAFT_629336 [Chytriomyces cf. hyalinus JEL632]